MGKKLYMQTIVEIVQLDKEDVVRTSAMVVEGDGINWEECWSTID